MEEKKEKIINLIKLYNYNHNLKGLNIKELLEVLKTYSYYDYVNLKDYENITINEMDFYIEFGNEKILKQFNKFGSAKLNKKQTKLLKRFITIEASNKENYYSKEATRLLNQINERQEFKDQQIYYLSHRMEINFLKWLLIKYTYYNNVYQIDLVKLIGTLKYAYYKKCL